MNPPRFDKAYYDRYYRNPATRVCSPREVQRQGEFIAAYLRHLEVPVKSVLDIGCGLGRLLGTLAAAFPKARAVGVESSPYLCDAMGWEAGSLPDFPTVRHYDLVICYDVLSYLNDDPAAESIKTLGQADATCALFRRADP